MDRLDELRSGGRMCWIDGEHGWLAEPDEVVHALASEGFQEYKREVARTRRDRRPSGGMWQGLNAQTGAVAAAVWVQRADGGRPLVFIEIDGQPVTGEEWPP